MAHPARCVPVDTAGLFLGAHSNMKIKILSTFLDGTDRFEKGDERTVDDERAERLV